VILASHPFPPSRLSYCGQRRQLSDEEVEIKVRPPHDPPTVRRPQHRLQVLGVSHAIDDGIAIP
jgi:hypothetical protein